MVSVDNQAIIAEGLYPGLTTMALPHYEMGEWAVSTLLAGIERSEPSASEDVPPEHVVLPLPDRSEGLESPCRTPPALLAEHDQRDADPREADSAT